MKQPRQEPIKPKSDSSKAQIGVATIGLISAITVAIISMIGVVFNAYLSSRATQASILIPLQYTQTAESKLTLESILITGTATTTSVSVARPTTAPAPGATLSAVPTAAPATTVAPRVAATSGTPSPTGQLTAEVTPVVETTETPAGPLIRSFPAPAARPSGIARVGDGLLVSAGGKLYSLDLKGNIKEEIAFAGPCFGGAWDDQSQSLWCTSGRSVHQLAPPNWQEVGSFETELNRIVGLAWDESTLWVIDADGNLAGYDRTGQRLRRLAVAAQTLAPSGIVDVVWIKEEFWVVDVFNGVTRYDSQFNTLGSSDLERCGASFPSALALFWDGESLWLADATDNRIHQCIPTD